MRRNFRLLCSLAIGPGVLLVAGSSLASAAPISRADVPYAYIDTTSCSFPLAVQGETTNNTTFVNGNGRVVFSFHGSGTVSANGKTFKFFYDGKVTLPTNGYYEVTGLQEHVNVPGAGLVIVDVGHLVFDSYGNLIHISGQHDFSVSSYSGLCQYF